MYAESELNLVCCEGALVVHADGSPAVCTRELEGLACAGTEALHSGGTSTCEELLGEGGCEVCAADTAEWEDHEWRHAVHVGRMVHGRQRCREHLTCVARRPTPTVEVVDRALR
jgi:hypothetical protein